MFNFAVFFITQVALYQAEAYERPLKTFSEHDPQAFTKCSGALEEAGAAPNFGERVGHAIHSMTVRDLRMFDPGATEVNYVPTINPDLSAAEAILPNAPGLKTDDTDEFLTDSMKKLDFVLTHMDDKNYDIKAFSTLERVVHVFHMGEVWAHAKLHFDKLQSQPPNETVCDCAMDIDNNGVMRMLRYSALAIREPALIYGIKTKNGPGEGYYVQYQVTYHFFKARNVRSKIPQLTQDELFKVEDGMPKLNSSSVWKTWKKIARMPHEETFDSALFLYCAVQKAKLSRNNETNFS